MNLPKYMAVLVLAIMVMAPISMGYSLNSPLIVVNKDKVDADYANMLLDSYYSKRELSVTDDKKLKVLETLIYFVPAIDEFELTDNTERLEVSFKREGSNVIYKDVEYKETLESDDIGDEVSFMGSSYTVLESDRDKIVLGNLIEDTSCSDSFTVDDITVKLLAFSKGELMVDVLRNGKRVDNFKLFQDDVRKVKGEEIALKYDDLLEADDKKVFFFNVYRSYEFVKGDDLEGYDDVRVDIDGKTIELEHRNADELPKNFNFLNYNIELADVGSNTSETFFKIVKNADYTIDLEEGSRSFGNNVFAVKIENDKEDDWDDQIFLYKNNKLQEKVVDFQGSVNIIDQDELLMSSADLILVGGPVANQATAKIQNGLIFKVSNENPGENKGIIQKVTNPFNKNSEILVLAGSDKLGTKACVLAMKKGLYNGESTMTVEYVNDNTVKVLN
ncbi:S-layer protein [Methanococcus voltae]|uniref:S-layer protein outer domain-containing protein n=2 Tax=Methanococcus voltae TaxID=2188 RepID=A0A8J7RMC9_METVO|nr:S-layer protein [Methanococcus voltae]MBP2172159.1 hypothetical protein [Methanococcus voltae]MBP2200884.1 hypothetical protein [Methanococcus voltae]MCS3921608.1 hypothetical protein [Methanococcus voltae PS]